MTVCPTRSPDDMARILVVDDEESVRLSLGTVLEHSGHEVIFAGTGEAAMKAFLRRDVDVVVTDLHMPAGDGLELIDALSGFGADVPIIAVSGKGPELLGMAKMIGARTTLQKPASPEDLLKAVDEALQSGASDDV